MRIVLLQLLFLWVIGSGLLLVSCVSTPVVEAEIETPYHDALTQFIVTDIKQLEGMKELTTYYIEVVDVNDLSGGNQNLKFWFSDTLGKYKLGQPIHFDKNR